MTVEELHFQFILAKDSVDALKRHTFNPAQIDFLLNDAQIRIVRAKTSGENEKLLGYEQTQKLADEFSTLHIKYPLQPSVPLTDLGGVFELDLTKLKYKYLRLMNGEVEVQISPDCKKYVNLKFVQSDDIKVAFRDPFNSPSTEFIPYNIGRSSDGSASSSLYIYPGEYTATNAKIEYLKYPNRINSGDYAYIDNIVYPKTTSELPEEMHHKIVDKAVELGSVYIMDPNTTAFHQLAYSFDS
jgi:hypothetical protein